MERVAALGVYQHLLPLRNLSVSHRGRSLIGSGWKPQCCDRSKVSNLFLRDLPSRVTLSSVATFAAADDSEGPPEDRPVVPTVPTVTTKFILEKQCKFGESFSVVGEDPLLGAWDLSSGLPMEWSEDHIWTCQSELPIGKQYEYKFVMISNKAEPAWQPGPNRKFETSSSSSPIIVTESWDFAEESGASTEETSPTITEGAAEEKQEDENSGFSEKAVEDVIPQPPSTVTGATEQDSSTDTSDKDVNLAAGATGKAGESRTVQVTEDSSGFKRFDFHNAEHLTANKAAKDSRVESVSETDDGGTTTPEIPIPETSLASTVLGEGDK